MDALRWQIIRSPVIAALSASLGGKAVVAILWAIFLVVNISFVLVSLVLPGSEAAASTACAGVAAGTSAVAAVILLAAGRMVLLKVPA